MDFAILKCCHVCIVFLNRTYSNYASIKRQHFNRTWLSGFWSFGASFESVTGLSCLPTQRHSFTYCCGIAFIIGSTISPIPNADTKSETAIVGRTISSITSWAAINILTAFALLTYNLYKTNWLDKF